MAGFGLNGFFQFRILFQRECQRDSKFVRDHLRDAVGVGVAQAHDAADIADDALSA